MLISMQTRQNKHQLRSESLSLRKDKNTMELPRFYSKPKNQLKGQKQPPKNYLFNSRFVRPVNSVINIGEQLRMVKKTQFSQKKCKNKESQIPIKPHSLKKMDIFPKDNPSLIKHSKKNLNFEIAQQKQQSSKLGVKFSKINFRTKSKTKQTEINVEQNQQQKNKKQQKSMKTQRIISNISYHLKEYKQQGIKDILLQDYEDSIIDDINQIDINVWLRIQDLLKNMSRSVSDIKSAEEYIVSDRLKFQRKVYSKIKDSRAKNRIRIHFAMTRITIYLYAHMMINGMETKITLSLIDKLYQSHKYTGSLLVDKKMKKMGEWMTYISRNNECVQKSLESILSRKRIPQNELFKNMLQTSMKIQSMQFLNVIDKTLKWEILKMPSYPFLPPSQKSHSLILDLDETLIHFNSKSQTFHVRPYAEEFIQRLSKYYEITIFTAATKDYADQIINEIDLQNNISFRLYRNHLTFKEDAPTKDISMLGRPINKTILVDNLASNLMTHPQNGVLIKSWYGDDEDDDVLNKLSTMLITIIDNYREDLRVGLKQFSQYISREITVPEIIYQLKQSL